MRMKPTNIYTVDQTAEILDVHPDTVRRYTREGLIKSYKSAGRRIIHKADIMAFMRGIREWKPKKKRKS